MIKNDIKSLMKALEVGMYHGVDIDNDINIESKKKLLRLLSSLEVKSATQALRELEGRLSFQSLEGILARSVGNFGKPDRLIIDESTLEAFKKATKET